MIFLFADTGIYRSNTSSWINGIRPMSQIVKAMFYFYFSHKITAMLNHPEHEIVDKALDELSQVPSLIWNHETTDREVSLLKKNDRGFLNCKYTVKFNRVFRDGTDCWEFDKIIDWRFSQIYTNVEE